MTNLVNQLTNVAVWLENGCESAMAAQELRKICSSLPVEPGDDDASLRRECVDLAAANTVSVAGCTGWPSSALLAFKLLCHRSSLNRTGD